MKEEKGNILFVEDDPFLVDIYSTALRKEGFNVEIAKNGNECLSKLQKEKPDLLLLDIVLPQMNGWEVLRKIKEDEQLKDLKIIILSNLGEKEEVEKGFALGVKMYLIKSHYTPKQVVEKIKKVLKQ